MLFLCDYVKIALMSWMRETSLYVFVLFFFLSFPFFSYGGSVGLGIMGRSGRMRRWKLVWENLFSV